MTSPSDLPAVEFGTEFYVPLPDESKAFGIVYASAPRRIYCCVMGPPVREPNPSFAWTYETWWVVDDIALHDGSWDVGPPRDSIEREPLRRFAATDSKRGVRVWGVYDPTTLHLSDAVDVDAATEAEWERAPRLLPADVESFESSLATTMDAEWDDGFVVEDDRARESRQVVALIRRRVDVARPVAFEHVLVFKRSGDARAAEREANELGLRTTLTAPRFFGKATLEVTVDALPAYPVVRRDIVRLRDLARRHDGTYDGFGG